ncbi:MAG: hypothetical protein Q7J30_01645 [Candidatus Azambacteria bacterium]|nr:hypothetical protein [Candidatus Azambacteria bacterium]
MQIPDDLWNAVSYLAFIMIIVGIFWQRCRNWLITMGAIALAVYAAIFLQNTLLTTLQIVIAISGILQLCRVSRKIAMRVMIGCTIAAYLFLIFENTIADDWSFIGSLGLLGIAFGLTMLPKRYGFLVMAAGGLLLIGYSFVIGAWVFFFLNIFFFIANLYTWHDS